MGWMIRVLGFDSQQGMGIFLFTTTSRMGALSLGVKWPVCEADHSPPSTAEFKE
jgi:hypothetical protein